MDKQTEVEDAAKAVLCSLKFANGHELTGCQAGRVIEAFRAAGFTICGPDEVPCPSGETTCGEDWQRGDFYAVRDAYQRERTTP